MMKNTSMQVLVLALLSLFASPVAAKLKFGVGDGLAIAIFVIIAIIATCALLGWISRKRSGN